LALALGYLLESLNSADIIPLHSKPTLCSDASGGIFHGQNVREISMVTSGRKENVQGEGGGALFGQGVIYFSYEKFPGKCPRSIGGGES